YSELRGTNTSAAPRSSSSSQTGWPRKPEPPVTRMRLPSMCDMAETLAKALTPPPDAGVRPPRRSRRARGAPPPPRGPAPPAPARARPEDQRHRREQRPRGQHHDRAERERGRAFHHVEQEPWGRPEARHERHPHRSRVVLPDHVMHGLGREPRPLERGLQ